MSEGKKSLGYYSVAKHANTRSGWQVRHEWYESGKRKSTSVSPSQYHTLGFRQEMTLDEARAHSKSLNAHNTLERDKMRAAARRSKQIETKQELVQSAYLPEELVTKFRKHISGSHFGKEEYDVKQHSRWNTVQELIAELEIDPPEYDEEKNRIYRWFIDNEYALDTTIKLLRVLNLWGSFVCKHRGQHFEPVKPPKGTIRERLQEAYADSAGARPDGSYPLNTNLLMALKEKLAHLPGQYEYMHVSLWFGLRPEEIKQFADKSKWTVVHDDKKDIDVLHVYQPKLVKKKRTERWKYIPIIYPEQKKAIEYIKAGNLKAPIYSTLKSCTGIENMGLRSGRKGFMDLMLGLGQRFDNISLWLGHSSVDTSWKSYKQKQIIDFEKPKKKAS